MGGKRRKFVSWGKLKNHPGQNTLEDLAKRKLTMCRSLQVLEHASTCRKCYQALLKNIKTK